MKTKQMQLFDFGKNKELLKDDILNLPIEKLDFSVRAYNVLKFRKLNTIKDILEFGICNLIKIRNSGKKTVEEISDVIKSIVDSNNTISFSTDHFNEIELFIGNLAIKENFEEKLLNTPIKELNLSSRTFNAIRNAKLKTIKNIIDFGLNNLLKKRNVGKKTIKDIKNAIITINKFPIPIKEDPVDAKLICLPVEELNLTVRALNALTNTGLKTIKDIYDFGLNNLQKNRNVGRKTIEDIKNAIITISNQKPIENEIPFVDAIDNILNSITPKYVTVVQSRYGYNDGKHKTLEEIGNKEGVTRERIRQIIVKEFRRIKVFKRKIFQVIIENLERLLLEYQGIVSFNDLAKDKYFSSGKSKNVRFMVNLFVDIYGEQYKISNKYFLTNLSNEGVESFQSKIREIVLKSQFPVDRRIFIRNILSSMGPVSKKYLVYNLINNENIEISKGKIIYLDKVKIAQKIKNLINNIEKPMHFTEIAKLYRNHYGYTEITCPDHAVYARISDSKDFIIVDTGTFILKEKFKIPNNFNKIIEVLKGILTKLKCVSDTRYLINELKKQNIDIGNLNEYSLKNILIDYPDFKSYGKFEIGLKKYENKYGKKYLGDLIYEVLLVSPKPLHIKNICKEISKKRGYLRFAIEKSLVNESRFIRISSATYTVAKHIDRYEEKNKIIIGFAKEWIKLKRNVISSFFICEVLKETDQIKDLSLGLVENVFSTSPEFIKIQNGFYDLANRN